MHTIKITPNLLFEYQCTRGKFIRLPNRIVSNRNFFARIGMLYCQSMYLTWIAGNRCGSASLGRRIRGARGGEGAERRFAPGRPHGDIFFPQVASRRTAAMRRRGGRPGPRRPPADNFRHRPSSLPLTTNTPDRFSRAPLHAGDFPTGEQRVPPYIPPWGVKGKGKVFPYSLPSVVPGADPGVQAVSPQVTWSESRHRPGSRLPLLSARPAVTSVSFNRWRYL